MHGGHSYLRERIFEVAISSKNLDTRLSSAGVLLATQAPVSASAGRIETKD